MIDASLGEILVTVEKLKWTIQHGQKALRPERRPQNFLMMYKRNEVRWEPLGVIGACVSWKYASPSSPLGSDVDSVQGSMLELPQTYEP